MNPGRDEWLDEGALTDAEEALPVVSTHARPSSFRSPCSENWHRHSWQIGNSVWTLDLAMTLEGRIDRNYLPTRKLVNDRSVLQPGKRPKHENAWLENV